MSNQNRPSLTQVQTAFVHWRDSGPRRRTPPALRAQAVSLLAEHSASAVMKALRVDHRRLSRWRQELAVPMAPAPISQFVELPSAPTMGRAVPAPPLVALTLTRQAADGSAVSIAGELSPEYWRWALELLQERGT